jgi:predicted transposase YbfD/YdcC
MGKLVKEEERTGMEEPKPTTLFESHFGKIRDPRIGNAKQHKLIDIIIIAICAVICGADSWNDVELYGRNKQAWLKQFLELPKGIPSHDTFGRLFARLDPQEFGRRFMEWVKAITELTEGQVIAIDGKLLRGSASPARGKNALNIVSAWATANQLVLGQVKVDEHSNEITAIPELLKMLELGSCLVTIDAIGTQTEIAQQIVDQGGDYLLNVKENQGHLYEDLVYLFQFERELDAHLGLCSHAKQVNKNHGRVEIRECWATSDEEYLNYLRERDKWKNVTTLAMIRSERQIGEQTEVKIRYFISSLKAPAKKILKSKRSHWTIENQLHWVLDISFHEDVSRVRKDHAPENFATIRHMALNLLKQEKTARGGIHAKRLQAGWNDDYLLKVLSS